MVSRSRLRNRFWFLGGVLAVLAGAALLIALWPYSGQQPAPAAAELSENSSPDHLVGSFSTIVDEQGEVLSMMARTVFAGDELYTCEGRIYRIENVEGDRAEAKFVGMDPQIVAYQEFYAEQSVPVSTAELAQQGKGSLAVYHTHTDESYVPSDGKESIPFKGGIYQVGKAMVDKLKGKGAQVHYDETPHDPHDNNAYTRSRRTAVNLLKNKPAAIFDVHRDGVPDPNYYRATIDGQNVARLRLVVGRENPGMSANMDFARRMMTAANNLHGNVVKEIFVGKGDYNQDLMPTALLIEAGTHTNTKEEAARGIAMFTEALPTVLGLSAAPVAPAAPATPEEPGAGRAAGRGPWKALGWILGVTIIGGLAFLLVSSGSWENFKRRLTGFGSELTSFMGPGKILRKVFRKQGDTNNPEANAILREEKDDLTKD